MRANHCGLYFTKSHIEQAQKARKSQAYAAAWALLDSYQPPDDLARAQHHGLRYRFAGDTQAGEQAIAYLQRHADPAPGAPYIEAVATLMTQAQCFEMVRDHPAWAQQAGWLDSFAARLDTIQRPFADLMQVDQLWLNALNLAGAVVLEREALFQQAVAVFQRVIDEDIHPEGYILKAVNLEDEARAYYGDGLYRMLLSAQALILTAEAAAHAGVDLWAYEQRGVSALTPTPYLLYYYYFPEKWRWDEGLLTEPVQALYRRHAGLWDMAQRRVYSVDRRLLLEELRPVYDVWGGGLTTLTHGDAPRRGWFG